MESIRVVIRDQILLIVNIGVRHPSPYCSVGGGGGLCITHRMQAIGTHHLLLGLHFVHTSSAALPVACLLSASKSFDSRIPVGFSTLPPHEDHASD